MMKLSNALQSVAKLFWKPANLSVDGNAYNIVLFNVTTLSDKTGEFFNDVFGDGIPDGLDLSKKVPFAVLGGGGDSDEDEYEEGNLYAPGQTEGLLLVDLENATENEIPVYSIEVDGTAIGETLKQIDFLHKLKFRQGLLDEED